MSQILHGHDRLAIAMDDKSEATRPVDELFRDSLESVIKKYKSRLTKKEVEEFQSTTLVIVKTEIVRLQEWQGKEKKLMNMTRVNGFLNIMDDWSRVVDDFADSSRFAGFIWGPVNALLQAASSFNESLETLLDAYEQLAMCLPRLNEYRNLFGESQEMRDCLRWIYMDVLEFHLGTFRFFSGPAWKRSFRASWKDFEIKFNGTLKALEHHKSLLREASVANHLQQNNSDRLKVMETLRKYEDVREKLSIDVDRRELEERQSNHKETQKWLAAPSPINDHEQACEKRKCEERSGAWLFHKPMLKEWKDAETPDSSILWIHGIPGAGKTVLASKIIEACETLPDSKTIFFYCVQKDPAKNTFISIIKSLLNQALSHSRDALLPLCYEQQRKSSEVTLQSSKQAATLLESCLLRIARQLIITDQQQTHERQYVVIDGVDECEPAEWQQLVEFFQKLSRTPEANSSRLRILFVSQHTNQIEKALKGCLCVSILPADNRGDIEVYVRRRTDEIGVKFGLDNDQFEKLIQETCQQAAGMFLYARLVMDNLRDQPNRRFFHQERVKKFPAGLSEAYERILQRIKRDLSAQHTPERWDLIRMLLGWLVCARRLLKWQEIQLACCIDPDRDAIDFEEDKLRDHIRDYCGSLIEASPDDCVRFVHSTTSIYLVMTGFVNEQLAEMSLTTRCVRYLSMPCFAEGLTPHELLHFSLLGQYILQDYAIAKWQGHFIELLVKATEAKDKEQQGSSTSGNVAADQVLLNNAMDELEDALHGLKDKYEDAFPETSGLQVTLGAWDSLASRDDKRYFYQDLCAIKAHIQRQQRGGYETKTKVSILPLAIAFERNRSFLEDTTQEPFKIKLSKVEQAIMKDFYSDRRYKCPKLDCEEFFHGFSDRKSRKKHVDKHDRPFRCDVPACAGSLGFTSTHDLLKHERSFHPGVESEQKPTFEPLESLTPKAESTSRWPCPQCPKRFTRGFHMRNHIRTHSNERPFSCNECGKPFTRDYDRKRHEKTVHTGR